MNIKTNITILVLILTSSLQMSAEESRHIFRNFTAADGLSDNSAQVIHCTRTGRLVIETMGQINFYDGQRFVYIDPSDENIYPLSKYHGYNHLYFDRFHHIWLKNTHTVTCVDLIKEKFVPSVEEEFQKFGISQPVNDLFVDKNGIVWLLIKDGLYNVETKKTLKIRNDLNLQDLDIAKERFLLLFYENGLVEKYDIQSGEKIQESFAYHQTDINNYKHTSVLLNKDSVIYQLRCGNNTGILIRYDVEKNQWNEILRTPYRLNNLVQKDSLLYIPSGFGYWDYNLYSKKLKHEETLLLENGKELRIGINVMCFDRQGGLWVGTQSRGLLYAKPSPSPFVVYNLNHNRAKELMAMMEGLELTTTFRNRNVNCVYKDSRGRTWVGTSQGLQLYRKPQDMLPQIITKKDGLLNNVIRSVIEDQQHHIWVSTSYGVSCLIFEGDKLNYVNSYNSYDGVPNETFSNGKAICLPDGEIALLSVDHVVTFNPGKMQTVNGEYPFEIYPKLIRMLVNGNEISSGQSYDGKVIVEKALTRVSEINLDYTQNSASLVFSALNYFRPRQTCYRVRIKGLYDDWRIYTTYNSGGLVDSRGLLHLPLMSLHPGSYEIELQASMRPDRWESTPYKWVVNVSEPWWRTSGMLALFLLVLAVLIVVNLYLYQKYFNLKSQRYSREQTLIKRISSLARRYSDKGEVLLEPLSDDVQGEESKPQEDIDPKYINVMQKILPYIIHADNQDKISMHALSAVSGLDMQDFYRIISDNIYKNPRTLFLKLKLNQSEELLKNKILTLSKIAEDCGFVSPNYFIASFYREFHMTPAEYREKL